jgi:hypothetical protein
MTIGRRRDAYRGLPTFRTVFERFFDEPAAGLIRTADCGPFGPIAADDGGVSWVLMTPQP